MEKSEKIGQHIKFYWVDIETWENKYLYTYKYINPVTLHPECCPPRHTPSLSLLENDQWNWDTLIGSSHISKFTSTDIFFAMPTISASFTTWWQERANQDGGAPKPTTRGHYLHSHVNVSSSIRKITIRTSNTFHTKLWVNMQNNHIITSFIMLLRIKT